MESWHRVGQKVTPKGSKPWLETKRLWLFSWWSHASKDVPVFGCIYTVSFVGMTESDRYSGVVFGLKEMPGFHFSANGFSPVRETSIECFRHLLSPTPEQERELEDV